ncbi:MAG: tRNA pseudouridine(38-40) synthase TruA [Steroidobacteraceae bacterium]
MPRIAVGIEYVGSAYVGWQSQAGQSSVQGEVETALAAVAAAPVATTCAGRTDAGVHAIGQVAHFDTEAARTPRAWVLGANTRLPPDIALTWAREMPADFHARYSALARTYRYHIVNRSERPALGAGRIAWVHRPLDVERMRAAAMHLVGERDFSAFRAAECQSKTPMRHVVSIDVERSGDRISITVTANAFLHHMVRNMAGLLIAIGRGDAGPDFAAEVLAGRDRARSAATAPAGGLYFLAVTYPERFGVPRAVSAMMPG